MASSWKRRHSPFTGNDRRGRASRDHRWAEVSREPGFQGAGGFRRGPAPFRRFLVEEPGGVRPLLGALLRAFGVLHTPPTSPNFRAPPAPSPRRGRGWAAPPPSTPPPPP